MFSHRNHGLVPHLTPEQDNPVFALKPGKLTAELQPNQIKQVFPFSEIIPTEPGLL